MYNSILQFQDGVAAVNDQLVTVCGTSNPFFLNQVAGSLLGYTCVAVGILWRLRDAFQCSTWMPIYYNTVFNALCYNGVNGVWAIAATQFLTCLMTCIILTCRCVFFDLETEVAEGEENDDEEGLENKEDEVAKEAAQERDDDDDDDDKEDEVAKEVDAVKETNAFRSSF
jgi:hypothetical protein